MEGGREGGREGGKEGRKKEGVLYLECVAITWDRRTQFWQLFNVRAPMQGGPFNVLHFG